MQKYFTNCRVFSLSPCLLNYKCCTATPAVLQCTPPYAQHWQLRVEQMLLLPLLLLSLVVCAGNGNKSEEVIVQLKYA
jgi:hypothetical protein